MRPSITKFGVVVLSLSLAGCVDERSYNFDRNLFGTHKESFTEMSEIVKSHPEFRNVSLIAQNAAYSSNKDYKRLLQLMAESSVERVRVSSFKGLVQRVRLEDFLVKSWGIFKKSPQLVIVRYEGRADVSCYYDGDRKCRHLDQSDWYVCWVSN